MWGVRFDRKLFARLVGAIGVLILLLGIIWIVVSITFDHESLSNVLANVFIVLATLITATTLFSLLTLWPDPKGDARKEVDRLIRSYSELPPNSDTRLKTRVVKNIRAQAPLAKYTSNEVKGDLKTQQEARQAAGLGIVQSQWYDVENNKHFDNEYFDKLLDDYFEDIIEVLINSKSGYRQYIAIWTMDGMGNESRGKNMTEEDKKKAMIFHLNAVQKEKLCKVVDEYDEVKHKWRTSNEWCRFSKLLVQNKICSTLHNCHS